MAHYKMIALTNAVDTAGSTNDEYNEWHTGVHLPDVLSVDGVERGQRFRLSSSMGTDPWQYLAIYDIETDDIEAVKKGLLDLGDSGIVISEKLDLPSTTMWFAEPITDLVESKLPE